MYLKRGIKYIHSVVYPSPLSIYIQEYRYIRGKKLLISSSFHFQTNILGFSPKSNHAQLLGFFFLVFNSAPLFVIMLLLVDLLIAYMFSDMVEACYKTTKPVVSAEICFS